MKEGTFATLGCALVLVALMLGLVVGLNYKDKPPPTPTAWPYGTPLPPGWGVYRVQVRDGVTNMWIVEVERE